MESKRTATTYFIPPGKFLLMENALGNPDLIQSSVSSDCRVTIVDLENFPLDELEQWPTFRLTSADIKLKLGDGAYYIYIVVPTPDNTESTSAFISYNTALVDRDGYQVIETEDEEGNPKLEKGELLGKSGFKYYQCGVISARGENSSAITAPAGQGRLLSVDLGVNPQDANLEKKVDWDFFYSLFIPHYDDPKDPTKLTWIEAKSHMGIQGGVSMFIAGEGMNLPSIYDGLPIDWNTLIRDENGVLKVNPDLKLGGEGVSNFWDLSGIPSWITNSKPKYTYSEIEGTPDLSGYATESWVNTRMNSLINGAPAAYDTLKEIADVLQGNVNSIGDIITALGTKWTQDNTKIANWDTAYSWGNHANAGYALKTYVDSELTKYVTLSGEQTISGKKNFTTGGLFVNGSQIIYDSTKKYWKLEGDLLVTGGITMYGSDSEFTPSTIMDAIQTDGVTIRVNPTTKNLEVIGDLSGGVTDFWELDNIPSWITSSKPTYTLGSIQNVGNWADSVADVDRIMYQAAGSSNWVSKNLSDLELKGDYLPLSGGEITGSLYFVNNSGNKKTKFGWASGAGSFIYNYASDKQIGITDNGTPYVFDGGIKEIYHKGNFNPSDYLLASTYTASDILEKLKTVDGSGSGLDADTLDGKHYSDIINSNVASATKLETPRTIWGQSFDGSGGVSGDLTLGFQKILGGNGESILHQNSSGYIQLGAETSAKGYNTYINGNNVIFRYGTSNTEGMRLTSGGNVGIGTTNPTFKLNVVGSSDWTSYFSANSTNVGVAHASGYGMRIETPSTSSSIYAFRVVNTSTSKASFTINADGNVGIGTASPAYKLDVNGTLRATDATYLNSTLNVTGVTTLENTLTTNKNIVLTGTTKDSSNIRFSREGANYIIFPSTGYIAFATQVGAENITARVDADGIKPYQESVTLGTSGRRWAKMYSVDGNFSGNMTIGGTLGVTGDTTLASKLILSDIPIYKSQDDVLYIDGNLVVRGGITMYGTNTTSVPSILDSLPIASTTTKGIASFDSNFFSVGSDGKVTFIGSNNGGVADSVAWSGITGKPTTLSGYGITDAKISNGVITLGGSTITPLTSHQTIYNLTLQAGSFSAVTFDPNGAAQTVNIPTTTSHISEGTNLYYTDARAQAAITGGASTITTSNLTKSRALISNSSGKVAVSAVTSTELGYLDGVTSAIQTQLNNKLASSSYTSADVLAKLLTVDGSGSGLDADLLDGYHVDSLFKGVYDANINFNSFSDDNNVNNFYYIHEGLNQSNRPYEYGGLLQLGISTMNVQVGFDHKNAACLRTRWWSSNGYDWNSWREFAFTDSNVASATKLQTARTIWGQSFDGTRNVSGSIQLNEGELFMSSSNQWGSSSWRLFSYGPTVQLLYGDYNSTPTNTSVKFNNDGSINVNSLTTYGGVNNRYSTFDANGISCYTTSTGGYAVGVGLYAYDGSFSYPIINAYGSGSTLNYIFIGGTYNNPWVKIDTSANMLVQGGITMYSDQRKKTILGNVELSLKDIANAPLIEHYYNSDDLKTTHVGSIAQYWASMNDWFCKLDNEGYYTMEIQNCALASAISIARELDRYESKTDKTIKQLKKRICQLEEEVERLKSA